MANTYKVLGQASPVINVATDVYVVPVTKSAVVSTISLCNTSLSGNATAFSVAVVPSGAVLANEHYILYKRFIEVRDSEFKTIGITLNAGDKIVVESDSGTLSVSIFGNEIT